MKRFSTLFRGNKVLASVCVLGWAILILGGCEEPRTGPPAKDFFLPMKEGSIFEYRTSNGTSSHTKIVRVRKGSDDTTYIDTLSWDGETNKDSGKGTTYELPPREDVVMIKWMAQRSAQEAIVLKGPIAVGTNWPSLFTMIGPTESKTKTVNIVATGICTINQTQVTKMLGRDKLTCMKYTCPLKSPTLRVMEEGTYCRDVGMFESRTTIDYMNERQKPFMYEERLVKIN